MNQTCEISSYEEEEEEEGDLEIGLILADPTGEKKSESDLFSYKTTMYIRIGIHSNHLSKVKIACFNDTFQNLSPELFNMLVSLRNFTKMLEGKTDYFIQKQKIDKHYQVFHIVFCSCMIQSSENGYVNLIHSSEYQDLIEYGSEYVPLLFHLEKIVKKSQFKEILEELN